MWYMNYSQIMSPRPPLPRKVGEGVMTPSSYGSASPGLYNIALTLCMQGQYLYKLLRNYWAKIITDDIRAPQINKPDVKSKDD